MTPLYEQIATPTPSRLISADAPACDDSNYRVIAQNTYRTAPDAMPTVIRRLVAQLKTSGWAIATSDHDGQVLRQRRGHNVIWVEVNDYDASSVSVLFSDGAHPY